MRKHTTTIQQTWKWVRAALGGVLLMAGAGCICTTINMPCPCSPQTGPQTGLVGGPAGGNFVPVQSVLASGGGIKICNQTVSGTYTRFYPPTQTPNTGDIGFRGFLWNVTTGAAIPNTAYYLQWFVTSANTGCCTAVVNSTTDVSCPVSAGLVYRFTAHFKTGQVPPSNSTIELRGAWTQ